MHKDSRRDIGGIPGGRHIGWWRDVVREGSTICMNEGNLKALDVSMNWNVSCFSLGAAPQGFIHNRYLGVSPQRHSHRNTSLGPSQDVKRESARNRVCYQDDAIVAARSSCLCLVSTLS